MSSKNNQFSAFAIPSIKNMFFTFVVVDLALYFFLVVPLIEVSHHISEIKGSASSGTILLKL